MLRFIQNDASCYVLCLTKESLITATLVHAPMCVCVPSALHRGLSDTSALEISSGGGSGLNSLPVRIEVRTLRSPGILYNRVGWSLFIRRKMHWYLIIYTFLGMISISYLCHLKKMKIVEKYLLCSQNCYTLSVPFVQSELGKKAFMYASPTDWNLLQSKLKLQNVLYLDHFKTVIRQMEIDSTISNLYLSVSSLFVL